jgi:hypothetical protein
LPQEPFAGVPIKLVSAALGLPDGLKNIRIQRHKRRRRLPGDPPHPHRHVLELDIQGRIRLVDGDINHLNIAERNNRLRDTRSHRLNQVARFTGQNLRRDLGHRRIIDARRQRILLGGLARIQMHSEVHDKRLAGLPLSGLQAVTTTHPYAG